MPGLFFLWCMLLRIFTALVTCCPLNDLLLKELNRVFVDLWSLDIEGSEVSILKMVDLVCILFGLVFIESNIPAHLAQVREFMTSKGSQQNLNGDQDLVWQNPAYCIVKSARIVGRAKHE